MSNPQLPDRHRQTDFFVCDVLDAVPKDDMASMEHPIYSLSTKPDTRIMRYEHNGNTIEITPSVKGLATIHDKDILIYCVSQLVAKMNRGEPTSRTIRLKAYDLLVSTNRETSGDAYMRLRESFERLKGTQITTDIITNGQRVQSGFGLIDNWEIKDNMPVSKRMTEVEIVLSKWAYNAVLGKEVLTLPRDYFRLRKLLERRIYELARKHCGQQDEWTISLELLRKKCGSSSSEREFRRMVSKICEENNKHNHIPDYVITLEGDNVRFQNRNTMKSPSPSEQHSFYLLDAETYNEARIVAPGYDIHFLEQEWRNFWVESGKPELKFPDKAFIAFCANRYKRKPNP